MKSNRSSMYQLLLATVLACLLPTSAVAADDNHDIVVLSNRADLISGGDALVELIVPPGTIQALRSGGNVKIQASLDGVPVPNLAPVAKQRCLEGRTLTEQIEVGVRALRVR